MKRFLFGFFIFTLGGCAIGPDFVLPEFDSPKEWKGPIASQNVIWQTANPQDTFPRDHWWEIYQDTKLNDLENLCLTQNQNLVIALNRIDQARAGLQARSAAQLPTVQAGAIATNTLTSSNRPLGSYGTPVSSTTQDDLKAFLQVSYELDWLGRIRRDVESARASYDQSKFDFESVKLVLTAQLAQLYFAIRQSDEEIRILERIGEVQSQNLKAIQAKHQFGLAIQSDVDLQNSAYKVTLAQLEILKGVRKVQENAMATLVAVPAPSFTLEAGMLPGQIPAMPKVLTSELLQRRPDIASAERAMASANAQIGVAKAAYYPSFVLTPTYAGYEATTLQDLFLAPSLIWSLGLQVTQTLFDGGRLSGGVNYANATYRSAVANYRQTMLTAFEETQNALGTLDQLSKALEQQEDALASQNRAVKISKMRYEEGLDNVSIKLLTEQNQLQIARTAAQYKGQKLITSVGLIKALGGGWSNDKALCNSSLDCTIRPNINQ
jgi:NodT family efflux transporter outer membrane factor (OMF) lipoprotein